MHRLLKRQLKYSFGKECDLSTLDDKTRDFIARVEQRYEEVDKEQRFLENTISVNSEELTQAYKTIEEHNMLLKDEVDEQQLIFEQYTKAIDASYLVSKTDEHGIITYVNDQFCKISGYTCDELLGSPHSIVRHPDNSPELYRDLWETITKKKRWVGQIRNRAKDGSAYYVFATIFPLLDTKGKILEYIAIRTDITERVIAEKKLLKQKQYNQMLFDDQENIIITFDRDNGVVNANKKFFTTFGFSSLAEFKKNHSCICELFIEREGYLAKSTHDKHWVDAVMEHKELQHKAIIENRKGEERIYSVLINQVSFDDQSLLIASFTDITELELAVEIAEKSLQAKADFMANMSHEIRTPMNSIVGFTELLAKSHLDPKQKQQLSYIQKSTQTLLSIVNDILDFSKIESGKMEISLVSVNPFMELYEAINIFSSKAREKNISLLIDIDSAISECIQIDKLRIVQILNNLISNALKFTPQQGTVAVHIKQLDKKENVGMIRFSVADTGIGIAEDRIHEIFESFIQEDSSTTRNFGGTGLGLSISQSLCGLMGSKLQVKSRQNEGSTFYFDLKVKDCISQSTLSSQINNLPVYVVKHAHPMYDSVLQQLTNFKISFIELEAKNIPWDNQKIKNIILFDHKQYNHQMMRDHHIILIDNSEGARRLVPQYRSIHHIHNYDECPSLLYNAILEIHDWENDEIPSQEVEFKLSVLVAEDYELNRILIEEILQRYTITPTFAVNGEEAVEKAAANTYDIIFMDINMPVMNGVDACKAIRHKGISTPIVALTANALEGDKEQYLAAGMDAYLSKPIEINALHEILEKYADSQALVHAVPSTSLGKEETPVKENEIINNLLASKEKMHFSIGLMKKLYDSFVTSSQDSANVLLQAAKDNDIQLIKERAHAIRGAASSLSFENIAKLCNVLEYEDDVEYLDLATELKEYIDKLYDAKAETLRDLSALGD